MKSEEKRFQFGKNWRAFSVHISAERVATAERSLESYLGKDRIAGCTFLDIGCGSGLFSLAAHRLGARKVVAFDYDVDSVETSRYVREKWKVPEEAWEILQGSVLDEKWMNGLEQADIVYSWGVLHHTGDLWKALDLAAAKVAPNGRLFIALYNDQGGGSRRWLIIKRFYQALPRWLKPGLVALVGGFHEVKYALVQLLRGKNPLGPIRAKAKNRGMSVWYDWVDWIGGYPFEVSKPEDVFYFLRKRKFTLVELMTTGGGHGCNQYVFRRDAIAD